MRPVHVSGFAQLPNVLHDNVMDEAEMVRVVTAGALERAGLSRTDVGFTCSGSNDYVMGRPFSFTMALDGLAAWPPISESHVEMDGAWALYEAWVRLQHGDIEAALVYSFGKSSLGSVDQVHTMMLDPYSLAPLGPGPMSLAAIQARILLDSGRYTERDFAAAVARSRRNARGNENAPPPAAGEPDFDDIEALLAAPWTHSPLRAHDAAVRTDGAAAIVLTAGGPGPRISGIAHRIDCHQPGQRDLRVSPSTRGAAEAAGLDGARVDAAELHAPYAPQALILADALGLGDGVAIDPSGGALAAETPMVAGLIRIGEAAAQITENGANSAVATATSGPCLQHNLVCVLERS